MPVISGKAPFGHLLGLPQRGLTWEKILIRRQTPGPPSAPLSPRGTAPGRAPVSPRGTAPGHAPLSLRGTSPGRAPVSPRGTAPGRAPLSLRGTAPGGEGEEPSSHFGGRPAEESATQMRLDWFLTLSLRSDDTEESTKPTCGGMSPCPKVQHTDQKPEHRWAPRGHPHSRVPHTTHQANLSVTPARPLVSSVTPSTFSPVQSEANNVNLTGFTS